jgi:hypothetical protein
MVRRTDDESEQELAGAEGFQEQDFVPLWELPVTWSAVWQVWPVEHKRALPETRGAYGAPTQSRSSGSVCHFIRSPWPEVSLEQILRVMWNRVTKLPDWETNEQRGVQVAQDVLALGPAAVAAEASTARE